MWRICLLLAVSIDCFSQTSGPPPAGEFSIAGVLTNSITGEPLRGARVLLSRQLDVNTLRASQPRQNISAEMEEATTSVAGEFQFHGLVKGRYSLFAEKSGFVDWQRRKREIVALENASVTGVKLALDPLGSLEGTVTDQDGEPIRYARVVAIQKTIQDGFARYSQVRNVSTDDLGAYKLWNLQPGKYWIRADGRSGSTMTMFGELSGPRGAVETFPARYADGASSIHQSTPITIDLGTKARADFRVALERSYRITGTLSGVPAGPDPTFELVRDGEPLSRHRASFNRMSRKFEVYDVPAGNYTLRASVPDATSEAPVRIGGDENPPPVALPSMSAAQTVPVTVHLRMESEASEQARQTGYCFPKFLFADPFQSGQPPKMDEESTEGLVRMVYQIKAPGAYRFILDCFGNSVTSIRRGSSALQNGGVMQLAADSTPEPIHVAYTTAKAVLNVECPLCTSGGAGGVNIVAVPVRNQFQLPLLLECASKTCGPAVVAPGEYQFFAFSADSDIEIHNRGFFEKLQGGVIAQVREGESSPIVIKEFAK